MKVGVAGVVTVELEVRDKIELGSEAVATVRLYSNEGLLPESALKYVTLVSSLGGDGKNGRIHNKLASSFIMTKLFYTFY